jgi:hypothetical protein
MIVVKKLANDWKTYRTRFLVQAKQLTAPLRFFDSLGREHSGVAGDYLVEYSGGVLRIAPRQLFEDIYVSIDPVPVGSAQATPVHSVPVHKKSPYGAVASRQHFSPAAVYSKLLSS